MSFLEKISRTISGLLNDAAESTSDAGRDARQIVREMEEKIQEVENAVLNVKAEHNIMQQKQEKQAAEVTKWANAATKAVAAGDNGLARECLEKKATANDALSLTNASLDKFGPTVKSLTDQLAKLRAKKDEMAGRTDMIAARSSMAEAQETAATVISGIGGSGAAEDFEKLENDVAKKEARAQAAMGMANDASGQDLEDRVSALGSTSIDDELAALVAATKK